MKKVFLKSGLRALGVFATVMVCVFACMMSSCTQDDVAPVPVEKEMIVEDSGSPMTRAGGTTEYGIQLKPGTTPPFSGEPTHGIPGVTEYRFFVANPPDGTTGVDIVFTAPDGNTYPHSMAVNPAGNWLKEMSLLQSGHYTVVYKIYQGSSYTTVTPYPSYVDNTYVNFSSTTKQLVWPFGADGSSYSSQGNWYMNCGHGCNRHVGSTEFYSLDWTKTGGSNGATVKSPLDGVIVRKRFHADGGNQIGIEQTIGNSTYAFQIGHLQSLLSTINVGDYVRAGETVIGYVGQTGNAEGPHAHTTLRTGNITSGASVAFDFSAKP
jgi:hypothetical protein